MSLLYHIEIWIMIKTKNTDITNSNPNIRYIRAMTVITYDGYNEHKNPVPMKFVITVFHCILLLSQRQLAQVACLFCRNLVFRQWQKRHFHFQILVSSSDSDYLLDIYTLLIGKMASSIR